MLGGAVLAAAGVGSFLKDSIAEAREAQKVGALTANVIKQTGGAANISAKQVGDLATAISLKTGIDDEAIASGANLLLTFKNVRNEAGKGSDVFNRATQAATDLSAAGFGDLSGASKQLGKALNDPVKGISALSRSGVTFTAQQQTQIKALVASGKTLDAQKIILGEVESQVGGAAAAASTYGEKASVAFGNVKEQVGTALLPVIDSFFQLFLRSVPTITNLINGIGPAFTRVQAFLAPFIAQIQGFFSGGTGGGFLAGLQSVAAAVQTSFIPVLQTAAATFTGTILPAISSFVSYVTSAVLPIFRSLASIVLTQVLPIYRSLATFLYGTLIPAVVAVVVSVASKFKPVFDQLVATFRSSVLPTLQTLLAKFRDAQPALQKIALAVVKLIGKLATFSATVLSKVLPVVIRFAGFLLRNLVPAVASVIVTLIKIVAKIVDFVGAVADGVKAVNDFSKKVGQKIGDVETFFKNLPKKIVAALGNAKTILVDAGKNIITGLINGLTAKLGALKDKLSSVTGFIKNHKGPEKVDKALLVPAGRNIMDGLMNGIESRRPALGAQLRTVTKGAADAAAKGLSDAAKKAKAAAKELVDGVRDGLKEKLSGLRDDFASLSSSVAGAFTGNLFEATNTGDFIKNLLGTQGQLQSLKAAFNKLLGYGLKPAFLSQLFASGNGGLILDLAAQDQATATQAGALFGNVTDLSAQLGDKVANADVGPKIDTTNALLAKLVSLQGGAAVAFAQELNGAATGGKKKGHKGSGGKGKK